MRQPQMGLVWILDSTIFPSIWMLHEDSTWQSAFFGVGGLILFITCSCWKGLTLETWKHWKDQGFWCKHSLGSGLRVGNLLGVNWNWITETSPLTNGCLCGNHTAVNESLKTAFWRVWFGMMIYPLLGLIHDHDEDTSIHFMQAYLLLPHYVIQSFHHPIPFSQLETSGDEEGRFFLDFNPQCFSMVVEYLRNRRLNLDAPLPVVPQVQKRNMELLAEAWMLGSICKELPLQWDKFLNCHLTKKNSVKPHGAFFKPDRAHFQKKNVDISTFFVCFLFRCVSAFFKAASDFGWFLIPPANWRLGLDPPLDLGVSCIQEIVAFLEGQSIESVAWYIFTYFQPSWWS